MEQVYTCWGLTNHLHRQSRALFVPYTHTRAPRLDAACISIISNKLFSLQRLSEREKIRVPLSDKLFAASAAYTNSLNNRASINSSMDRPEILISRPSRVHTQRTMEPLTLDTNIFCSAFLSIFCVISGGGPEEKRYRCFASVFRLRNSRDDQ